LDESENRLLASAPFLARESEFCIFACDGQVLLPRALVHLDEGHFQARFGAQKGFTANIAVSQGSDRVEWRVEVGGSSSTLTHICFPFLKDLTLGEGSRWIDFYSLVDRQGRPILNHRDADAPLVVTNGTQSLVLLQSGDLLHGDYSPENLRGLPGLKVPECQAPRQVYQGAITLAENGWRGAFATIRCHLRSQVDLSEYQREDLKWYTDQFVQHFTFLYGREILDLEKGLFNVDRFLDEGERDFGGYDGFLIWGVYPRIGVDERTQWDFYDDLPGGRAGLREMSRRARERGVRFFVPYKPWDRSAELHGQPRQPHEEQLAQLIVDSEADGVFLDTMDLITPEFRLAIDQSKPGVVFCSEGRTRGKALDIVTGCWDQSPNRDFRQGNWCASEESMPMTDLWRFVLPEHRLFVINRHSTAADRICITQRAFFNGMGWVIWQNIFGLALPYSPPEAALLKKCRTIFRENRSSVNSPAPTPLIESGVEGLYANEFPVESKRLWTFYNENDRSIAAAVSDIRTRTGFHLVDVWNGREASLTADGTLLLEIEARQVGCVVEYPQLLEVSTEGVRVSQEQPDLQLVIEQSGSQSTYPLQAGAWVVVPGQPGRINIRLLKGQEVLDQLFIEGER